MKRIIIPIALVLSGCTIPSPKQYSTAINELKLVQSGRSNDIIDEESLEAESLKTLFDQTDLGLENRNKVLSRLMAKSDINCNKFIEAVDSKRANTNVALGFWSTATATAAAIVAGRAGQNLAGISAVTSATAQSINDELFSGILMPNIVKEIKTSRETLRARISTKFQESATTYTYHMAVSDAIYYHNLCSITVALSALVNKASEQDASRLTTKEEMLGSIDTELQRIQNSILSNDLGLSATQKDGLRSELVKLSQRRSELVKMYALPTYQSGGRGMTGDGTSGGGASGGGATGGGASGGGATGGGASGGGATGGGVSGGGATGGQVVPGSPGTAAAGAETL
ncbi:hypothetical protein [Pseudomonas sp. CFBP 5750]